MVVVYSLSLVIVALLPGFIWLVFFLKEDVHPEPKRLIASTFLVGALASVPVLAIEMLYQDFVGENRFWLVLLGLALIEETFKFCAAWLAVHASPEFDEPIDAMVYMIAAALGFATVENLFVMLDVVGSAQSLAVGATVQTLLLRFVGATLLHTLTAGLIGYYWALGKLRNAVASLLPLGIALATVVHIIFNYLIFAFEGSNLFVPSLFLLVAAFFVLNDFEKLKRVNP